MLLTNRAALARLARQYAGPGEWQDLLQDIHLQLWRSFDSFDGRAKRSTWVYRVALNTALGHRRKPRIPHRTLEAVEEPVGALAPGDPAQLLEQFLAALEPVSRAVMLLHLEGLDHAQVGEVLGLSAGAVAVRMNRLKQQFESTYVEESA